MSELKARITADMKDAMRAGDKDRLGVIRLLLAALKQREVDERITLDDAAVMAIIEKMVKQRRDSVQQYSDGGRPELAAAEEAEIGVLSGYLPEQLSADEIAGLIEQAISATGAEGMKDMGKLMGWLKPKLAGRADTGAVSAQVKAKLA